MKTQSMNNQAGTTNSVRASFAQGSAFGAAYERRLPEIRAVKEVELTRVTLDVQAAVAQVLGALPEIQALREGMGGLSTLDLARVDGLGDYALALAEANSRYIIATTPKEDIVALNEAAVKMREVLRSDAHALAVRGLIPEERLTPFKGLVGYKNVAFELVDWANLLAEYASASAGRLSLGELSEAKQLGERLVEAAGHREQGPAAVAEAAHIRQQALTLLVNAYDEVRRAISFLRWREDDVETIAPSLYGGRARKRTDVPAEAAGNAAPGNGASGNGAPAVATPATAVTPAVVAPPAPSVAAPPAAPPPVAPIAPGLPGANPFV
jgi:hypothetical protein